MHKTDLASPYSTQILDHLGLVSGIAQDLDLVDLIDSIIGSDSRSHLSHGQVVLAMLVNGLGFTTRPMYLSPQFFRNKPVDLLIGPGVGAKDLNDYQFGKTLDAIYSYGCTKLFSALSSSIFLSEGLGMRVGHYDTTSVSVHGEGYEGVDEEAIEITFGYSKDSRPDLRQYIIGLMVEPSFGIPWMFRALDGNSSDKTHFQEVIASLQKEAKAGEAPMLLIADSALFTEDGLSQIDQVHYVTRVPHTIAKAKELLLEYQKEDLPGNGQPGYRFSEVGVELFGKTMRWLVVWSEQANERERNTFERTLLRQEEQLRDALAKLKRKDFACQEDAQNALTKLLKTYKYLQLDTVSYTSKNKSEGRGRPRADAKLKKRWRVHASWKRNPQAIAHKRKQLGKFILATNQLNQEQMPAQNILAHYKNQYQPEKGFRFLKSPLCMADALYLKKPERIQALSMIMCLALMVYGLGERKLRQTLKQIDETVPDQKGKPTQKPTLRWIFQCFEGISILTINLPNQPIQRQVLNLNVIHKQIIAIFAGQTEKIYLLAFSP